MDSEEPDLATELGHVMRPSCRPALIIAEAGVNHNGDPDLAFALIDAAAEAGADIVKFQTFKAEAVVSTHAPKATYQKQTTGETESQLEMVRKLELPFALHPALIAHCQSRKIGFLSTPFDSESIEFLNGLGMGIFKIPSGEITNLPYLRQIGKLGKSVILSTGMSDLEEVAAAVAVLQQAGTSADRITLLHCTTEYPCPYSEVNLRAMIALRQGFPAVAGVGYSDHTTGIEISLAAVAMGATVIEKHFTLDRTMVGPDHAASLEPDELKMLVTGVRHIEAALGNGIKTPTASELPNRIVARKSIVARHPIRAGETLSEENLTTKRPGNGTSPMLWDQIIGTPAPRDLATDEAL